MGNQLKDALKGAGLTKGGARERVESPAGPHGDVAGPRRDLRNVDVKVTFGKSHGRPKRGGTVAGPAPGLRTKSSWVRHDQTVPAGTPAQIRKSAQSVTPAGKSTAGRSAAAPSPTDPVKLQRIGPFRPNPLLSTDAAPHAKRLHAVHDGIAGDLLAPRESPNDAADLVIGLDFGTSCVKVVIGDYIAERFYAVPFTESLENPYLLPSRVFRTGGVYSLDGGESAARDLKLGLLGCGAASPVGEFNDACAFLALVIRHSRGWLFSKHMKLFRKKRIKWLLNLGLPARSYEDEQLVRLFRRLAWASANLAALPSSDITGEACDAMRRKSAEAADGQALKSDVPLPFSLADVDVVPEVAAQIHGFVMGTKWDWKHRPMMMIVDVGAGTVDTAFFSYTKMAKGEPRIAVLSNDVQPSGVMNLHRERIAWLLGAAAVSEWETTDLQSYLSAMRMPTDRLSGIPETVGEYVGGCEIALAPGAKSVDEVFYRGRIRPQVSACPQAARSAKAIPDAQLTQVPCFLTGGGSRMGLYRGVVEDVNHNGRNISLQRMTMAFPTQNFICPGLRESDMDRLSVAYGLAHHGAGGKPLGGFIRSIDIPPDGGSDSTPSWRDNYISKDDC